MVSSAKQQPPYPEMEQGGGLLFAAPMTEEQSRRLGSGLETDEETGRPLTPTERWEADASRPKPEPQPAAPPKAVSPPTGPAPENANAPKPQPVATPAASTGALPTIENVPTGRIAVRPDLFQARDVTAGGSYDEERVRQITGNWNPERFDPLSVVADPEKPGSYIVIGGHHRLEAVRRLGLETVPVRVLAGDINVPQERRRLEREAVVSNFGVAETNLREKVNAAGRLADSGMDQGQVAREMRLRRGEAERLLWLRRLPPGMLERVMVQPELAPAAAELGRAVDRHGMGPETVQGLFTRWDREYEETGHIPGQYVLRQQLDGLAAANRGPEGEQTGFGGLEGFGGDVVLTRFDKERHTAEDLQRRVRGTQQRLTSCEALAQELGVDIGDVKDAAQTRLDVLTAEQEASVRRTLTLHRAEAAGEPPPSTPDSPSIAPVTTPQVRQAAAPEDGALEGSGDPGGRVTARLERNEAKRHRLIVASAKLRKLQQDGRQLYVPTEEEWADLGFTPSEVTAVTNEVLKRRSPVLRVPPRVLRDLEGMIIRDRELLGVTGSSALGQTREELGAKTPAADAGSYGPLQPIQASPEPAGPVTVPGLAPPSPYPTGFHRVNPLAEDPSKVTEVLAWVEQTGDLKTAVERTSGVTMSDWSLLHETNRQRLNRQVTRAEKSFREGMATGGQGSGPIHTQAIHKASMGGLGHHDAGASPAFDVSTAAPPAEPPEESPPPLKERREAAVARRREMRQPLSAPTATEPKPIPAEAPALPVGQQSVLGNDFATNRTLSMEMPSFDKGARAGPMAPPPAQSDPRQTALEPPAEPQPRAPASALAAVGQPEPTAATSPVTVSWQSPNKARPVREIVRPEDFEDRLSKARRELREATKNRDRASSRRRDLPPGSSRARVTTANANWTSAAERLLDAEDRLAAYEAVAGHRLSGPSETQNSTCAPSTAVSETPPQPVQAEAILNPSPRRTRPRPQPLQDSLAESRKPPAEQKAQGTKPTKRTKPRQAPPLAKPPKKAAGRSRDTMPAAMRRMLRGL